MRAMILAAGRGERMRPYTDQTPKPLLEVRGKPLIVRLIEVLVAAGIRDLVINLSHLGERIEASLDDGRRLGAAIRYSHEAEALETAGGIAQALSMLGTAPFIAVNGDLYCDFDFSTLAAHRLNGNLAHLVLVPNPPHHPEGDFTLSQDRVGDSGHPRWTFGGIGLYRPELFADIQPGTKRQLASVLRAQMERQRVTGELYRGMWHDVGTPERLSALNERAA